MSISPISNNALLDSFQSATTAARQTGGHHHAAATLFGESGQQLEADLRSGNTSMSALAASRGISQTDLINAIKQGLQNTPANSGLTDTQLTDLATTVANRVHGGNHHAAAALFGESGQQLEADLRSGNTSMSALAASRGISQTDLINAIKQGLQNTPANSGLTDTQLTDLATTIADRVHGSGGPSNSNAATAGNVVTASVAAGPATDTSSVQASAERAMFTLRAGQI